MKGEVQLARGQIGYLHISGLGYLESGKEIGNWLPDVVLTIYTRVEK